MGFSLPDCAGCCRHGSPFTYEPEYVAYVAHADGMVIAGSLSEHVTIEIGGVPQGMIIKSIDPSNPVPLFLHGGPGMPEFFLQTMHRTVFE